MAENQADSLREEISQNMSFTSKVPFAISPEELAFNARQVKNRCKGKENTEVERHRKEARNNAPAVSENIMDSQALTNRPCNWVDNLNQEELAANQQNNKAMSENLMTMRENIKNSQNTLRRNNSETTLTIEEALRGRRHSVDTIGPQTLNLLANNSKFQGVLKSRNSDSRDSLTENSESGGNKDPYTAGIDLSNKCRKFYFNHLKSLETVKQAVRTAKHNRALEKMEGKPSSSLDNALQRLHAEMAELMDQDLSLMSQMLKLNDKIEDFKSRVAYQRQNEFLGQSSWSMSEISDSECSDADDSKLDIYNASTGTYTVKTLKYLIKQNQENKPPFEKKTECKSVPDEGDIIVYRKKGCRCLKRNQSISRDDDVPTDNSDNEEADDTLSETDTILSGEESECSDDSVLEKGADENAGEADVTSKKEEASTEQPKTRKGGISNNTSFAKFHQTTVGRNVNPLTTPLLNGQGHNISLEKYFVPQGLVYVKHANATNVFCQFTH